MFNQVPFTENPDEWHCIHAAIQGVVKHFSRVFYSFNYINALMCPRSELWVWPFQAVKALSEVGMFVRLFSQQVPTIESIKVDYPSHYSELTCVEAMKEAYKYVKSNNLHSSHNLSLTELEQFIHDGCIPIVILGSKKHLGKYVLLTGYDAKNFYYHDSGPDNPAPNKPILKKRFLELWMKKPSDNTVIIVYGKKFQDAYTRFNF